MFKSKKKNKELLKSSPTQQHQHEALDDNEQAHDDALLREVYHTDSFSNYMMIMLAGGGIVFLLLLSIAYVITTSPKPKYFVANPNKQIFAGAPVNEPMYNGARLQDWASQAAIRIFDFNFVNYNTKVQGVKELFTPTAYSKFVNSISQIDLPTVVNGKFVLKTALCSTAKVVEEESGVYNINGVATYSWLVTVPIYFQYVNVDSNFVVIARLMMRIQRMSELDYLGGLAISDLQIQDRTNALNTSESNYPVCNRFMAS